MTVWIQGPEVVLQRIHRAIADWCRITEATWEVFVNPRLRDFALNKPRGKFETVRTGEWCPWILAQITEFLLKSTDVANFLSGPGIIYQFGGWWRWCVVTFFSIRLMYNVIRKPVTLVSSEVWIGFVVGIWAPVCFRAMQAGFPVGNRIHGWCISYSGRENDVQFGVCCP